jgi:hypothetical protein
MPLLKQFSDRGGAVKELQPFGGFLAPERLSVLHLAVGGLWLRRLRREQPGKPSELPSVPPETSA